MDKAMTIGRLARAADVGVETIRHYQRQGLLPEPEKPPQGYRLYAPQMVARLQFIKRAKQLGFTLREIRELLTLGDGQCRAAQRLAREKAGEIEARIRDLDAMLTALQALLGQCNDDQRQAAQCSLLAALRR